MYSAQHTFQHPDNRRPRDIGQGQSLRNTDCQSVKVGFPIRKYADQRVLAPPRILSQRATSFIASQRQGIRWKPLVA